MAADNFAEALEWLSRAAGLNQKAAGGEVWREIGGTQLDLGRCEECLAALERYVGDREYDPIGLVYYAEALDGIDRSADARACFERALEAIRTMPQYRRGELRPWAGRAKTGLRRRSSGDKTDRRNPIGQTISNGPPNRDEA